MRFTPRKRNMLEAFQDGLTSPAPEPAAPSPPRGRKRRPGHRTDPGPFSGVETQRARSTSEQSALEHAPMMTRIETLPAGTWWVGAGFCVLLVGFWLGRLSTSWWGASAGTAHAADLTLETRTSAEQELLTAPVPDPARSDPATRQGAATSNAAPAPTSAGADAPHEAGYTADDLAFLDRSNKVTLRAISYDPTPSGQQKALASYAHLRAQGIPAVAPFVAGDLMLICVGAAPSVKDPELERLRQVLLTLPGPPPRDEPTPYATAFIVNIDNVVVRD